MSHNNQCMLMVSGTRCTCVDALPCKVCGEPRRPSHVGISGQSLDGTHFYMAPHSTEEGEER